MIDRLIERERDYLKATSSIMSLMAENVIGLQVQLVLISNHFV
jgi:hypothetical protein